METTTSQSPLAAQSISVFLDKSCYVWNTSSPTCCACREANWCWLMRLVIISQVTPFSCLQVVPLCWLGSEVKQEVDTAWKALWRCMCLHACEKIRCTLMHPFIFLHEGKKSTLQWAENVVMIHCASLHRCRRGEWSCFFNPGGTTELRIILDGLTASF